MQLAGRAREENGASCRWGPNDSLSGAGSGAAEARSRPGKVEVRMAPSPALASRGNSQAQLPPGSRTDAGDLILRPVALAFFFFFFSFLSSNLYFIYFNGKV